MIKPKATNGTKNCSNILVDFEQFYGDVEKVELAEEKVIEKSKEIFD
jgi:hypothetical protein